MTRYGAQYGPDYTFLGVPKADLDDRSTYDEADVVVMAINGWTAGLLPELARGGLPGTTDWETAQVSLIARVHRPPPNLREGWDG